MTSNGCFIFSPESRLGRCCDPLAQLSAGGGQRYSAPQAGGRTSSLPLGDRTVGYSKESTVATEGRHYTVL